MKREKPMFLSDRRKIRPTVIAFAAAMSLGLNAATIDTSVAGQVTITVPANEDYTLSVADTNALSTSKTLIKEGLGRLIIDKNMSAWSGNFGISNGYVRLSESYADGKENTGLGTGLLAQRQGIVARCLGTLHACSPRGRPVAALHHLER